MPLNASSFGLLGPGFDAMAVLKAAGQTRPQRDERALLAQQKQTRSGVADLVRAGNYQEASATAMAGGEFDMAKQISALSADHRKELAAEADGIANLAYSLPDVPAESRAAIGTQTLQRMGVPAEHIGGIDWSDDGLRGYYGWAQSVKEQVATSLTEAREDDIGIDNRRDDRNTDSMISHRTAQEGATLRAQDLADSRGRYGIDVASGDRTRGQNLSHGDRVRAQDVAHADRVRGQDLRPVRAPRRGALPRASQSGGAQPTAVRSKADYDRLAAGAEYIAPDGSHKRKGG